MEAPNLSIILVTSPVKSHPDTKIIDAVIHSFSLVEGLEHCPIYIVFDGFVVAETARTKSGRITADMAVAYDEYFLVMRRKYGSDSKYRLLRSESHRGFAMAVRWGLESCSTEFALVVQQDRSFSQTFRQLPAVLSLFGQHSHIRYIGFPTSCSVNHEIALVKKYGLTELTESSCYIPVSDEYLLKPLIFWYDSTHVCHVQRYLTIYRPFRNVPSDLKELFGGTMVIKDMILRDGDFIEDRYGQAQRNILKNLRGHDLVRSFQWFGTYLLMPTSPSASEDDKHNIYVSHLRGRTFCPIAESQANAVKGMLASGELLGNKALKVEAEIASLDSLYEVSDEDESNECSTEI